MRPSEVLTAKLIEPDWIVKGMIPRSTLIILAGEAGAGKSYLMYSLAYAVVTGRSFLGHATQPVKVLYFDEENGEPDFLQYNQWVWAALGCPSIEGFDDTLRLEHFQLVGGWHEKMRDTVRDFQPGLVIIDTATPAFHLKDENDNAEANRVITELRAIQAQVTPKPTVIVLKHEKQRDEDQHRRTIRGAKVWLGAFDQVLYHIIPAGARRRKDGTRKTALVPDKLRSFALRYSISIEPEFVGTLPKGLVLKGSWDRPEVEEAAEDTSNTSTPSIGGVNTSPC